MGTKILTPYPVGYRRGQIEDRSRQAWDGTAARPIAWSAWYPAGGNGPQRTVPGLFDLGALSENVPLAANGVFPVILMSHGTGGAPEGQGWLARRFAAAGYIALAPHHHGNTGREPYRAEGFLCWWERAADLTHLLTALSASGPFAGRLDLARVHGVGFSLGCHSVLALVGALTSMERFFAWAKSASFPAMGPREFPGAVSGLEQLLETSKPMQASWARQALAYHDPRIRSVIAMAPPPPVRAFSEASLATVSCPVTLITGGADAEAPLEYGAAWLTEVNPGFQHLSLGPDVGHYSFLGLPAGDVPDKAAFLFEDLPGLDRTRVHDLIFDRSLAAIEAAP